MRFITATQLFSGTEFIAEHTILVVNNEGTIIDVIPYESIDSSKVEHFKGVICPGFVNTHCHLELSHLKDKIIRHTGIVDFALAVIKHRNELPLEIQQEAMQQADKEMYENGIVAVGDISNTSMSLLTKQQSSIYYHTFVELIALNPERANSVFSAGKDLVSNFENAYLSASLASHAPYSTSLNLIEKITNDCYSHKSPTSIHNQESKAENDFFKTKTGDYLRMYDALNIPIDYFVNSRKSSLQTVIPAFNKNVNTLLVHNTFSYDEDIVAAQQQHPNLYWCWCPQANLFIEGTIPDTNVFIKNNCKLTLGTDSLASNSELSIIAEINSILKLKRNIPLELLLKSATYSGACFLGIENRFGLLEKGKTPGLNLITEKAGKYSVKKLV